MSESLAESDWPEVVYARLSELERLTEDWDSYGSKPVAPEVSARVRALLHQLMTPRTRTPQVVPLPDGGLQLEWHTLSSDLEICVPASGGASFFYQDVKSSSQLNVTVVIGLVKPNQCPRCGGSGQVDPKHP